MVRKGFLMEVKPGKISEYTRAHNPIPEDLREVLKQHGVSNYSIFHDAGRGLLFGCAEIEDEEMFSRLSESPVCRRWWKRMTEYLVSETPDADKAIEDELREVFHMD